LCSSDLEGNDKDAMQKKRRAKKEAMIYGIPAKGNKLVSD